MGHKGPTPPPSAGPTWSASDCALSPISSLRNPKAQGATIDRFSPPLGAENTERERSLWQTDFCWGNSFPERGDRHHQHHHQAILHRDHHHHHHHHIHQHIITTSYHCNNWVESCIVLRGNFPGIDYSLKLMLLSGTIELAFMFRL